MKNKLKFKIDKSGVEIELTDKEPEKNKEFQNETDTV
jgi:hypothetical protein